ncbi:MAG TPA: hypothetical protein PK102_00115 [bacterium]|nr:hypothetical protein [bacterium]
MKHIYVSVFIFLFLITCQSAPKKEISMYDVSSDMKRNDQARSEKETIQSAPQMKKKEYSPAETVFITTLTFASIPAAYIEFDMKQKKQNEISEFLFFQVENDDMFLLEGKIRKKEKSPFFNIKLPGLMD